MTRWIVAYLAGNDQWHLALVFSACMFFAACGCWLFINPRKVIVYSYNGQGQITSKFANIAELQKGRGEMIFLKPGDQVFVSGKGFSIEKVFDILSKASIIRMFMGGGLPF